MHKLLLHAVPETQNSYHFNFTSSQRLLVELKSTSSVGLSLQRQKVVKASVKTFFYFNFHIFFALFVFEDFFLVCICVRVLL